jgi:hypothetical protein
METHENLAIKKPDRPSINDARDASAPDQPSGKLEPVFERMNPHPQISFRPALSFERRIFSFPLSRRPEAYCVATN